MITAKVVFTDRTSQLIEVYDSQGVMIHKIQYGDVGDGFCYHHQDFDCERTFEEKEAINKAE